MAKKEKAMPVAEYRHRTSIGENGQILFDAPVQIRNQDDLNNYHIKWSDCQTITLGNEQVTVYFMKLKDRTVAEYLWSSLSEEHNRHYVETRCFIPGQKKAWIRCPKGVSCADCPHQANRKSPVISLDGLAEVGYEPGTEKSAEDNAIYSLIYRELRTQMDTVDPRLAKILEAKILYKEPVKSIAERFGIKAARIYQLLDKIEEIGSAYKKQ